MAHAPRSPHAPAPVVVRWSDAPRHLSSAAAALGTPTLRVGSVAIIGITGPVASGKSTLAAHLSPCIIATDNYLPDYETIPYLERDQPRHADLARLAADLALLREGRAAQIPIWSFHSHKREGYREVAPARIVVVEGIHALHDPVAELLDLRVLVDAARDLRWSRWEQVELSGQRGWGVEHARHYFDHVAEPTFNSFEPMLRARADILITDSPA